MPKKIGEGLTPSEAKNRKYPQVGKIDTAHDAEQFVHAVEADRKISPKKKEQRLTFFNVLLHGPSMKKSFKGKGNLRDAQKIAESAVERNRLEKCQHCGKVIQSRGGTKCPNCGKEYTRRKV